MSINNQHKPGYKHTPLGWIPEEWKIRSLADDIQSLDAGVSVNSINEKPINGEPGILKTSAVNGGCFFPEQCKKIIEEDVHRAKLNPRANSIIISRMNTPELVGECGYVDKTYNNIFLPDRLWQTQFHSESEIEVQWLNYLLNEPRYKWKIKGAATGTSNSMKNISKDAFLNIAYICPTNIEQRKIAAILSTWDEAITKTQQLIAQLQRRNKGLMQQLLTGKKRLKGFEGDEWKKLHATEIYKSVSVKNNGTERLLSATQDRGIIPRDMLEARVTMPTGETGSFKLVEIGDFVISLRSFQGGIEYSEYRGLVSPAYTVLKPTKSISTSFFKHYFKSYDFIGHLAVAVIGIRDGKQVSYEDFSILKLPYPNVEEQEAIATVLDTAVNEVKLYEQKLAALQQQKKGLMQQLLTGKVRVKID